MNRADWERQVHESNMNVTAKCIALVVGSFGNWTVDKTVEPGATKVAKYAGVTRDTVNEYITAMVEQGWLKPVGTGQYNTTIYELCEVVADSTGKLARAKRNMNPNSTAKLNRGHKTLVAGSTDNYKDTQDSLVADTTGVVADTSGGQLPIPEGLVAGSTVSNLKEPSNNNLDKNLQESPVSDEPVAPLNLEDSKLEEVEETLEVSETLPPSLNLKEQDPAKTTEEDKMETGRKELLIMNPVAKKELLDLANSNGATERQIYLAAYLLGTGQAAGWNWREKCESALEEVGVSIMGWAV